MYLKDSSSNTAKASNRNLEKLIFDLSLKQKNVFYCKHYESGATKNHCVVSLPVYTFNN